MAQVVPTMEPPAANVTTLVESEQPKAPNAPVSAVSVGPTAALGDCGYSPIPGSPSKKYVVKPQKQHESGGKLKEFPANPEGFHKNVTKID